jgi:hypothetical protein
MKSLLLTIGLLTCTLLSYSQNIYQIRADSVRIYNNCDTAEFILENHTQMVPGYLYNRGRGRTEFRRMRFMDLGQGLIAIGDQDTLNLGSSSLGDQFIRNQFSTAQLADYWIKGRGKVDGTFTLSKYKNNATEDSVLTTDVNGNVKLKLVGGGSLQEVTNAGNTTTNAIALTGTGDNVPTSGGQMLLFIQGDGEAYIQEIVKPYNVYNPLHLQSSYLHIDSDAGVSSNFTVLGNAIFRSNGIPGMGKIPVGTDAAGNWTWNGSYWDSTAVKDNVYTKGESDGKYLQSLNGLTDAVQTFIIGTYGTDFNISSNSGLHVFNLPSASTTARGVVTTGYQEFAGSKTFTQGLNLVGTPNQATTATKYLTLNGNVVNYRTPAQTLSDIGAAPANSGTGYIQNQTTTTQTAAFKINSTSTIVGSASTALCVGQTGGTSTNYAGIVLDGVNGDFTGVDYLHIYQQHNGDAFLKNNNASGNLILGTGGGTERMRIDASGNVGIGTNAPTSTLQIIGSVGTALNTVTTSTTLNTTYHTILVNNSANITITLPAAATCAGRVYVIKKISNNASTVSIDPNASENIEGSSTPQVISTYLNSFTIQCDGTAWWIL